MIKLKKLTQVKEAEIMPLYREAGWKNYVSQPEMLMASYLNSLFILGAYDEDQLVGVIRVVGDGYSIIYIQDLIVSKSYQNQGIGKKLVEKVLHTFEDVYQKVLLTDRDPKLMHFYSSLGFVADEEVNCISFIQMKR